MKIHDDSHPRESENIALCELLDRVLNKGVVIVGELTISVANIDLIYLGLNLILTSIETARKLQNPPPIRRIESAE